MVIIEPHWRLKETRTTQRYVPRNCASPRRHKRVESGRASSPPVPGPRTASTSTGVPGSPPSAARSSCNRARSLGARSTTNNKTNLKGQIYSQTARAAERVLTQLRVQCCSLWPEFTSICMIAPRSDRSGAAPKLGQPHAPLLLSSSSSRARATASRLYTCKPLAGQSTRRRVARVCVYACVCVCVCFCVSVCACPSRGPREDTAR